MTFSSAGVTWWSRIASTACSALSHSTSQLSLASAVPLRVGSPPAIVFGTLWSLDRRHGRLPPEPVVSL